MSRRRLYRKSLYSLLLAFAVTLATAAPLRADGPADAAAKPADAKPDAKPAPQPTTIASPLIDPGDLKLLLEPLTRSELEIEAGGWYGLLRAKVREVTEAELAVRRKNREIVALGQVKDAAQKVAAASAVAEKKAASAPPDSDEAKAAAAKLAEANAKLEKSVETSKKEAAAAPAGTPTAAAAQDPTKAAPAVADDKQVMDRAVESAQKKAEKTGDETKVADALKPQVEAGNVEAMRALGPMYIRGRGVKQDPATGLALLKRAVEKGSPEAESDLSQLYLNGAPGIPVSRPDAMKWLASSAQHGNVTAMLNLGYMSITASIDKRDLTSGYCWLMRAALLDNVQAQEKLSTVFAEGEKDDHGNAILVDLIQADYWFKLAARSPYHNNPQIRSMIEPNMTTDQQKEASKLFDAWQVRTFQELKTTPITLPGNKTACPALT